MRPRRVLVAILFFALAASAPAAASDAAEVELVRRAVADAEAASASVRASEALPEDRAAALLERYVDVPAFEARVLADVAASLTPSQKKTLDEAIRPLLAHRIALRLRELPQAKPAIDPPREEGGETRLRLVYKTDGDALEVDLAFARRAPNASLRVVDATIGGTSLSKNLRASINKVMRKEGFDALVARLVRLREAKAPGPHRSSDLTL